MSNLPNVLGFYWAQWRIVDDDSSTDEPPPVGHWEVVELVENGGGDPSNYLRVSVGGELQSQSRENFVWGAGPLERPL